MLVFPNCKINLGLNVIEKRADGYHNLETVFYPFRWLDALEIIKTGASDTPFSLTHSGLKIEGDPANNLIFKAWQIMSRQKKCSPVKVRLHKNIPMGAGLGGGSADAAYFINCLNDTLELGYTEAEKMEVAGQLGSDCAFFIKNQPVFAFGRGNEFGEISVDLSGYFILAIFPDRHSNTKEAYEGLRPRKPDGDLRSMVEQNPVDKWKDLLVNDFEPSVFQRYPEIKKLKDELYGAGALYASMSGSGSAVFGIFNEEPVLTFPKAYTHCLQKPASKIL